MNFSIADVCGRKGSCLYPSHRSTGIPEDMPVGIGMLRTGERYTLSGAVNPGCHRYDRCQSDPRRCLTLSGVHNYHPCHLLQVLEFIVSKRERFPFRVLADRKYLLERIQDTSNDAAEGRVL